MINDLKLLDGQYILHSMLSVSFTFSHKNNIWYINKNSI